MTDERKQKLAAHRAELYAPAPTGGSIMAGICTGVMALLGVFVVSGFYAQRVEEHLVLAAAVTAVGFLAGLAGYKRLARANRRATRNERRAIDDGAP